MTTQISQVDAVVKAVAEVLGSSFVLGNTVVSETLTDGQVAQVKEKVSNWIIAGSVRCNKDTHNEKSFNRYVNGMIKDHFNKSRKLNGGKKHQSKSKGVPNDTTLKELNRLLKTQTSGTVEYSKTLDGINRRKAELSQLVSRIDTSVMPAEVHSLLNDANT
jgi:hypothetical protein